MKNNVYIINSAPGVGKSTLLKNLHLTLPNGFAVIDGDDVGRIIPYQNDLTWLNLIQDNMVECCMNFKRYGFNRCIISFVFPTRERLKRLVDMLTFNGFSVTHILLECSDLEIEQRITKRDTSRMISIDKAKMLNHQIKDLYADYRIDTTKITAAKVSDLILDYIGGTKDEAD